MMYFPVFPLAERLIGPITSNKIVWKAHKSIISVYGFLLSLQSFARLHKFCKPQEWHG